MARGCPAAAPPGMGSLKLPSLLAVAVFMATGFLTAGVLA
jgi:hypothetical protein